MKTIFGTVLALLLIASPSFAETALSEAAPAVIGGTKGADTDECDCKLNPDGDNENGLQAAQDHARAEATFQSLGTGAGTVPVQNTGTGAQ